MNVTETVKLLVGIGLDLGMHQVSSLLNVAQSVLFLLYIKYQFTGRIQFKVLTTLLMTILSFPLEFKSF